MKTGTIIFHLITVVAGAFIIEEIFSYKSTEMKERIPTALGAWNNPCNIKKPNGQRDTFRGEIVIADGSPMSSFSDVVHNARAAARIINTKYLNGLNTISKIIRSYDPVATEEAMTNYENSVAQQAGIAKDADIGTDGNIRSKMIEGIMYFEQGHDWAAQYADNIPVWASQGYQIA